MKFFPKLKKILAITLPILLLVACDDDDNSNVIEGTNSILNYFQNNDEYSEFLEAVNRVDLAGTLDGNSGTLTIFAPDNEAVDTYLAAHNFNSINDIPEAELRQLVSYHVLESIKDQDNFVTGYLTTLARTPVTDSTDVNLSLFVNAANEIKLNGESTITTADIDVDNGILHKVDNVLDLPTLETFLKADDNLILFYEGLTTPGLPTDFEAILSDTTSRKTFFVPGDLGVQAYFDEQQITSFAEMDTQTLDNLLRNHFLDELRVSSTFKNEYLVTGAKETLTGNQLAINAYMNTSLGLILNGNATIGVPNIIATNGVLHVLDQVLTLPSVADFIQADPELSSFSEALNMDNQASEDYIARLNEITATSEAPFTVFGPNDEAFANVLLELFPEQDASLEDIDPQVLTAILNLHLVINQEYHIEELPNGSISTLGGTIQVSPEQTLIDANGREANFLTTNHQAINGVLHTIDTVLLPQQ